MNVENDAGRLWERAKNIYIGTLQSEQEKAQAELGMSRADSYQKEYISLEEGDKAEVEDSGGSNIFESIANAIGDLWS